MSPTKDWSPATESTRADSEVSSPFNCQTFGDQAADSRPWNENNVKLNLFEHLSPPVQNQATMPAASPGNNVAVQQMMPAVQAPGAWEMYPVGMNAGAAPSTAMFQYATVDQQQCPYSISYSWGEPIPPWASSQQTGTQTAMLQQQLAPQMQPADSSVGLSEPQVSQQLTWHSLETPQLQMPGTPRASKCQLEDTPSTPLNKVVKSVSSPALPSPWIGQRTPSPTPCLYNANHFHAAVAQQPQVPVLAEADPWAVSTLMVVAQSYQGEAKDYLSVSAGSQVRAMIDTPHCGDSTCAWPTYVFCSHGTATGWVPQQLLWRCFVDENGRRWACDDSTGNWCWVDEMEKSVANQISENGLQQCQ